MRISPLAYVTACLLAACSFNSSGVTVSGAHDDASTGASTTTATSNDPGSTTTGVGSICVPDTPAPCECPFGAGQHTCNLDGEGYGPCMCPEDPTTTVDPGTTTSIDPSTTSVDPDTSSTSTTSDDTTTTSDDTTTTVDPSTTTSDDTTTTSDDTTSDDTTTGDVAYGACPRGMDDECLPDEMCIQASNNSWSLCTPGPCQNDDQCDHAAGDVCQDAPGDGQNQRYCVPQTCTQMEPCPIGMMCFQGIMNLPDVCLWP